MYVIKQSKNGTELERFNKIETAKEVLKYYLKRFPNACIEQD